MAKKQTPLQAEYAHQIKRIKAFVRRASKRGFMFPDNLIPPKPKVITRKAVEKLKEMTPPSMYKEAHWVDPTTGEYVSGYQGRKTERKRAARKGQRTKQTRKERRERRELPETPSSYPSASLEDSDFYADIVILNFKSILSKFNAKGAGILEDWIDHLITNFGKREVAVMLERGAQEGLIVTYDVVYAEQLTRQYMAEMVRYISSIEPEDIDSFGQDFYDALEEDDGFTTYE